MLLEIIAKSGTLREGENGEAVKALQRALRAAGHELVIDGDFGSITRAAVERFQAASNIAADGLVGPVTAAYLDAVKEPVKTEPLPSVVKLAPWLAYMRAITGTKEIPGARSNPLILSWVRALGAKFPVLRPNIDWYVTDQTPWCGLGAAAAVGLSDPGFLPPLAPLRALAWGPWGVKLAGPAQGAFVPMRRKGGGHITIYEGEDKNHFYCRGANQNDQINVAQYPKSRLTEFGFRWPSGAALPKIGAVKYAGDAATAVREA